MNNQIIYSPTYRNYPINTQNGTMGCYDKTLEKIYNIALLPPLGQHFIERLV